RRSELSRSSGYDGLMQENVFMRRERVVRLPENMDMEVAAYSDLISVAFHAITRFKQKANSNQSVFGVWGDGNLGFITCLLLKT
ncbi:ribitol-5-phosphate dehydrogenase, partial [Listeria monocytogenes]|nr:ribitol-5-phosphate dehydrogenase [Listeria monocytogenes]